MKQNTLLIIAILSLGLIIGGILVIGTNMNETKKVVVVTNGSSDTYKLEDLRVTYTLSSEDKDTYDIKVLGVSKTDTDTDLYNSVRISGKACNNQNGNFIILDADEATDKAVLVNLDDGRQVLDSPVVSTMMACLDATDPKYDDAALSGIITNIAKSLESY